MVWVTRHIMVSREKKSGFALSGDYAGPPAEAPFVNVIIPAKDEGHNIETCVRGWLEQDYPNFRVTVCNDRSEDDTGKIVEAIAAEDDRLELLNIEELPEGWAGKNHAVWRGAKATDGEWILMTDADCRQTSTRTLSVSMQYALDEKADMLSVLPRLEMLSFWERVVQPVCGGVMMIWFHPDKVNDPARPNAYANGALILTKRSVYEAIGTHEAIRGFLMEDMQLAKRVKQADYRLRVVREQGLYCVRMYDCLRDILRGWCRIFLGTFGTGKRLTISLAVLWIMGWLPYIAGALGLSLAAAGVAPTAWWWACGAAGVAAAMMQISVIYRFYKLIDAYPHLAWLYPLGCLMASITIASALTRLRSGATVTWKNTVYENAAGD
jgi:cellulose synthase/poly-beta-1,6-N-acetylglucosamine synthase-like glycosyltransferase